MQFSALGIFLGNNHSADRCFSCLVSHTKSATKNPFTLACEYSRLLLAPHRWGSFAGKTSAPQQ